MTQNPTQNLVAMKQRRRVAPQRGLWLDPRQFNIFILVKIDESVRNIPEINVSQQDL